MGTFIDQNSLVAYLPSKHSRLGFTLSRSSKNVLCLRLREVRHVEYSWRVDLLGLALVIERELEPDCEMEISQAHKHTLPPIYKKDDMRFVGRLQLH